MSDWVSIDTAPDDFERPGGQREIRVRDRFGAEYTARRSIFNNTGWREVGSNREIAPVEWSPSSLASDPTP